MKKLLPNKLQHLVSWSVALLGESIREEYGEDLYQQIERTRKEMKSLRQVTAQKAFLSLQKTQKRYKEKSALELYQIAHGFSLMLELMNSCEIVYRTYRIEARENDHMKKRPMGITYVLTAHPTEARSSEILELFKMIQPLLLEALHSHENAVRESLKHLLKLGLHIPMARTTKPTVEDEAKTIYGLTLRAPILDELVRLKQKGIPVYFRAWVGGDKDGHPGVDEKTMLNSLQLSRTRLLEYVRGKFTGLMLTLNLLKAQKGPHLLITKRAIQLEVLLKELEVIKAGDGIRVKLFYQKVQALHELYLDHFGIAHPELDNLKQLLWIFPAMVLPLELREDSAEVREAVKDEKAAISRMLILLKHISHGYEARWYVRGFVLSMVESSTDLIHGLMLAKKRLGTLSIPVVPLFENEKALTQGVTILRETFSHVKTLVAHHQKAYQGRFEVMLGYSDSSKENGVFTSRYLISRCLFGIDKLFREFKLTPIFFHGSGGSIERGGGSVREQTQWWPRSAVNYYKVTVQGEMVARTFANEDLLRRQVDIISSQLMEPRLKDHSPEVDKTLLLFSNKLRENYSQKIHEPSFLKVIEQATPYSFLRHLKIGSRPSKRAGSLSPTSLRAIPWILCWTQTRVLFPTWWGVGSCFGEMSRNELEDLKHAYKESALLRSYIKVLGFTLAKVELPIWRLYLESSKVDKLTVKKIVREFEREYNLALDFVFAMTGEKSLVWFRPWLEQSINYRSSMIHPLNLIQIEALKRNDLRLLRESVTGISCGMLTTG